MHGCFTRWGAFLVMGMVGMRVAKAFLSPFCPHATAECPSNAAFTTSSSCTGHAMRSPPPLFHLPGFSSARHAHSSTARAASVEGTEASRGVEEVVFHPADEYFQQVPHHYDHVEDYLVHYEKSIKDPEAFWSEIGRNFHWETPWEETLSYNFNRSAGPIHVRFFHGGETNIAYNALDRHVAAGLGDRIAFYTERNDLEPIRESGPGGLKDQYTYREALEEVSRIANVLKSMGVKRGDTVGLFLPMVAELPLAMLACARIGAVHTVVFAGFSKEALADRLCDAGCKAVIACDGVFRGSKLIPLFHTVDAAIQLCNERGHIIEHTLVLERLGGDVAGVHLTPGRDVWWHEATAKASSACPVEWMPSEHPLFILYTSGSTGKPKGVLHTTGGYMIQAATTFRHVFNVRPEKNDIFLCTADCGWITGHSYVTYGPLLNGASQVVFEGVPSYPDVGRLWHMVDKYGITHLYTAPTAIRSLMREGDEHVTKYARSSLKVLGSVGEPINPEAWKWYHEVVGGGRCPIVDTWWQTETGAIAIAPLPIKGWGQKPGSASLPFLGIEPVLLSQDGKELEGPTEGLLAIKSPWPSTLRSIYGDHERMEQTYFSFDGYYLTGDNARRDSDGYYWITGRADDVVIVSGHNLGTAEVEAALAQHPSVAEAAVVGIPHDVKGNCLYCYVTLKAGQAPSPDLEKQLKVSVRNQLGAFAAPDFIQWAPNLPKTRSGKVMRRILRKVAAGGKAINVEDLGDTSTLADPEVIKELIANHV
uniref:Acetyl-coenzyme A synthetase n=1 Tax=Nannochloropsis gaditana (strain CCMP526) TaxID=1093141 RepID=I2CQN9_NANGC